MSNFNIEEIMKKLKEQRQAFFSEADFQFTLACIIKEQYSDAKVWLEYVPDFDQQMHIDILVILDNKWIPIELKYKTKKCSLEIDGDKYELKEHSARDQNCYRYLKDIQRIETIKENKKDDFKKGFTIFITNDEGYKKSPRDNCKYKEFSLEDKIEKKGKLDWAKDTSPGTKKGCENPIELKQTYKIDWETFSSFNKTETCDETIFYYILNEIE